MVNLDGVFRREWGLAVAALARWSGDLTVAEDAVQEAFAEALRAWPRDGVPDNPGGWVLTVARNRARDRLRRESARPGKELAAVVENIRARTDQADPHPVHDDELRMMFTCAHPALDRLSQLALTLRLVSGLTVAEIARALLQTETAVGQRITRAKAKVRHANIPLRVPPAELLPERTPHVLSCIYSVFTEGYWSTAGPSAIRDELCDEGVAGFRAVHSDAGRTGCARAGSPDAAARFATGDPGGRCRGAGTARGTGPSPLGRWPHCARPGSAAPGRGSLRPVSAAGGDRRIACDGAIVGADRLARYLRGLRHAVGDDRTAGGAATRVWRWVSATARTPDWPRWRRWHMIRGLPGPRLVASVRADLLRRAGRRDDAITWYRTALASNGSERAGITCAGASPNAAHKQSGVTPATSTPTAPVV